MANDVEINSLLNNVERVSVNSLKHHPENPRVGNVDKIADSLTGHGQYRPLVVQRKGNVVIAGNHTLKAARKLGWTKIDIVKIDVEDQQAKKILLMDNRSSDDGGYDQAILAEVLKSLDDASYTGYNTAEIDDILASVNIEATSGLTSTEDAVRDEVFSAAPLGAEDDAVEQFNNDIGAAKPEDADDEFGDDQRTPGIDQAKDSFTGAIQFKPPQDFDCPRIGYWGIPELDNSKLMRFEEIPEKLTTWAESYSRNKIDPAANDQDTWWFYNWGMSSSSGMDDISKVIVGFYSFDQCFDNWWTYPDRYATKLVNSGIKYSLTPDWSLMAESPNCFNLFQLFKCRWIGRYLQECGIKIMPHVDWPMGDQEFGRRYVWSTLPKGLPLIAMQFQTLTDKEEVAQHFDCKPEEAYDKFAAAQAEAINYIQPEGIMVYAGPPGQDLWKDKIRPQIDYDIKVRVMDSRLMRLNQFQAKRERKKTI